MRYLSVCSGIEAATAAWHPLGWTPAAFAEIEPFPSAVLAHHYPGVPNLGDFTTVAERLRDLGSIQLAVGGTPCQGFSGAGLGGGLADPRSLLTLHFARLAYLSGAHWLVWENVPGVLSVNGGRDFAAVLGAFTGLRVPVPDGGWSNSGIIGGGPGCFGCAYRVLDAQHFGVPQRRRRVFVVGYLGDWRPAAAVLFERHSLSGNPPPRRKAGTRVAGTLEARAGTGGYDPGAHGAACGHLVADRVAPTLGASGAGTARSGNAHTEAEFLIHAPVAFDWQSGGDVRHNVSALHTSALQACQTPAVLAFDTTQVTSALNRSSPKPGDPCHPLAAGAHPPALAFAIQERADSEGPGGPGGKGWTEGLAYTMEARHRPQSVAVDNYNGKIDGEVAATLGTKSGDGVSSGPAVLTHSAVRRITPVEAERLQGFPDGYTLIPGDYRPRKAEDRAETVLYLRAAGYSPAEAEALADAPDGPRYKALGNSMAVPVMAWIGRRIAAVEALTAGQAVAA
jgi:DNA (cytosine-5)-methyltransferase 1